MRRPLLLLAGLLLWTCQGGPLPQKILLPLPVEGTRTPILPNAVHSYQVYMEAGQILDLTVHQFASDLVLELDHQRFDGVTGSDGPEHFLFRAPQNRAYTLQVLGPSYDSGHYLIRAGVYRPTTEEQAQEATAYQYLIQALQKPNGQRLTELNQALAFAQSPTLRLSLRARLAWDRESVGDLDQAIQILSQVAPECHSLGERFLAAETYVSLANLQSERQPLLANVGYQEALSAAEASASLALQAHVLRQFANHHYRRGNFQEAIAVSDRALELIGPQYPNLRALLQRDQALSYVICGRTEIARDLLSLSRQWWEQTQQPIEIAKTSIELGWTWYVEEREGRALQIYRELLPSVTTLPDPIQAGLYDRMGSAFRQANQFQEAHQSYQKALRLTQSVSKAHVHANLADLCLRQGEPQLARTHAQQAAAIFRANSHPLFLANALFLQSKAQRLLGNPSQDLLREVAGLIQDIRAQTSSPSQSFSFTSNYYDMLLELVSTLLDQKPDDANHAAEAFEFIETVRGLSAWNQDQYELAPDGPDRQKLKQMTQEIDRLQYRDELQADPATAQKLRQSLENAEILRARLRKQQQSERAQRPPIDLAHIRAALLQPNSLMLSYCLSPNRSFVWAITPTQCDVFELPSAQVLRFQVENYLARLTQPDWGPEQTQALASALSKALLQPVAHLLPQSNLIIIKDDILHQLPFPTLIDPNHPDQPLIANHQIAVLPSATHGVLAKYFAQDRPAAAIPALVIADPVYSPDDPRLPLPQVKNQSPYLRLPYTADEATTIAKLQPQAKLLLDFQASRESFVQEDLSQYQVIHLAVHGQLHPKHGPLSSLLFSQYLPDGTACDGALRAHQLANLRLPVELVTLSGCKTALGNTYRGEGLWSLGRDCRNAGAQRVLVSLWSVDDRATAALMQAFYTALWQQGQSPAQALQTAQNQIRSGQDGAPYYWAGFELQGDLSPLASKIREKN